MADPLWEFTRAHRFGELERARLVLDDLGQPVLTIWGDHAEWEEVVLDREAAGRLVLALSQWLSDTPVRTDSRR